MGQEDTRAEARCNHLTRCPLESNGLSRATMISPVGCHRESPRGVCNEIPLLSKWHLCSLPRGCGACVAACRDLSWVLSTGNVKEDDEWPGQPRPSLRSASAWRSTGICQPSSDPTTCVDPEWVDGRLRPGFGGMGGFPQ